MWKNLLINDVGKGQAKNGGDDGSGTPFISAFYFSLLFQSFISVFYFSLLFPALYSGPLFPALYFSLSFHPSPAEEAQQEDGAAETEFDAHGGPDALEAERGG